MTPIQFAGCNCSIKLGSYANGRTAIRLVDANDGCPVATATVNLPDEPLAEGEVFIKDWAENAGMVKALAEAGIIEPTNRVVVSDFVNVPVCRVKGVGV